MYLCVEDQAQIKLDACSLTGKGTDGHIKIQTEDKTETDIKMDGGMCTDKKLDGDVNKHRQTQ